MGGLKKFTRKGILKVVRRMSSGERDAITLDRFDEMPDNELQTLVYISSKRRYKHVYTSQSLYNHCISRLECNLPANDPLNPSKMIHKSDVAYLAGLCNAPPRPKKPEHIKLEMIDLNNGFTSIALVHEVSKHVVLPLGVVPNDVEPYETGSVNLCSAVVLANIMKLWDSNKLLDNIQPLEASWFPRKTMMDFIADDGDIDLDIFIEIAQCIESH
jgi:hypothetical protein